MPYWPEGGWGPTVATTAIFLALCVAAFRDVVRNAFTAYAVTDRRVLRVKLMGNAVVESHDIEKLELTKVKDARITFLERGTSGGRFTWRVDDPMALRAALKAAGVHSS
jgi:hypothetical protein